MNRIPRLALALLAVLALVLTGCARTQPGGATGPTGQTAPAKATIGLTYIPDIQFAPFYVAANDGLFTEQGLDATLRHHGAQEGLFTALVAGQEQYVIAGGDELVQARAQGMDLVAIGQYYHHYPVVLIVPDTSPVQSAADLAGQRIGIPGRFGESWFGLQAALSGANLTEKDVEVVEIGYTAQAALTTGKVDAVVGFANNDQVQFELAGVPTRTVPLVADGDVPLVSIVLVTTGAELEAHPETAKKVARSMVAAMEKVVAEPASAVAAARTHIPTLDQAGAEASALATLEATIPLWTPPAGRATGTMDEQEWKAMTAFMLERGLVTSAVDPATAMTNEQSPGDEGGDVGRQQGRARVGRLLPGHRRGGGPARQVHQAQGRRRAGPRPAHHRHGLQRGRAGASGLPRGRVPARPARLRGRAGAR